MTKHELSDRIRRWRGPLLAAGAMLGVALLNTVVRLALA